MTSTILNSSDKYENVISLGYFCSVALETERIGLRTHSGPFDWQACIDFRKRIELIDTEFKSFFNNLNESCLYQKESEPWIYYMKACGVFLVHDFSMYKSLSEQLPMVISKYERRVYSFYKYIKKKTLFIYYVNTEADVDYINNNYDYILHVLCKFNSNNKIIFIANSDKRVTVGTTFYVKPDKGDVVSRKFLNANKDLKQSLLNLPFDEEQRRINRNFHLKKVIMKKVKMPYVKIKKQI